MRKAEFLDHWQKIEADQKINITPVRYKHQGSTYAKDGIRLTGSRQFIDSMLSKLKELLDHENHTTRLQVAYKESLDKDTGYALGSWNCYIQVHERGQEAQIMNQRYGRVTY
ncbi:unnamed protein product [marine sediment metagenome]|uniref:Uncharacterized protein n=1 Tax=marine sediment metagenome TaxID=412755 RepID=X1A900_9ZZZZ